MEHQRSIGKLWHEPVYTAGVLTSDGRPYLQILQRKRYFRWSSELSTNSHKNALRMERSENEIISLASYKNIIRIALPAEYYEERLIMCPVVIGVFGEVLMIQHITNGSQYLKFFLVNLKYKTVICLQNLHHYFKRDLQKFINLIGPVECHVSPSEETVLLRLPGLVLSRHKWSTVFLTSDFELDSPEAAFSKQYEIPDLYQGDMREFDRQALCMDPHNYDCTLITLIKDDSSKCRLALIDIRGKIVVRERDHSLVKLFSSEDVVDNTRINCHIKQCDVRYSKTGDIIVVSCWVANNHNLHQEIQLFMFNSENFNLIRHYFHLMTDVTGVCQSPLQAPVFTDCDTAVVILGKRKHTNFCKWNDIICSENLPRRLDLQKLCRSRIVQAVDTRASLNVLPLPPRLIQYLKYQ
ncbi:uncharacterized protein LOC141912493 [Tubulanus polymorphus]|uniref:uncharacterized protein LOC141912493 n=1 Tax=Tubulanus polymorphus TaxID=672921 RepID=UPI003DA4EE62